MYEICSTCELRSNWVFRCVAVRKGLKAGWSPWGRRVSLYTTPCWRTFYNHFQSSTVVQSPSAGGQFNIWWGHQWSMTLKSATFERRSRFRQSVARSLSYTGFGKDIGHVVLFLQENKHKVHYYNSHWIVTKTYFLRTDLLNCRAEGQGEGYKI